MKELNISDLLGTKKAVDKGERYVYIDTRLITPPYGIVSMDEILHACHQNLSGAAFGVYMYLLCICSGRVRLTGTEIGGRQIQKATGYSKATIYRALLALEKAELIKQSNRDGTRKYWLLCNPFADSLQDEARQEELDNATREDSIKEFVQKRNEAVNNPVNNLLTSSKLRQKNTNKSINSDTNTSTDSVITNLFLGGKATENNKKLHSSYQDKQGELIQPYLEKHFCDTLEALKQANQQDKANLLAFLSQQRIQEETNGNIEAIQEIDRSMNWMIQKDVRHLIHQWESNPYQIAEDLCNRLSGSSLLYKWGWSGTQSSKIVGQYIIDYIEILKRNASKYY